MSEIRIVAYKPEYLERLVELTLEGFRGVSIDHLGEEKIGFISPGWEARKAIDVRNTVNSEPEGVQVAVDGEEVIGYTSVQTSVEKKMGRIVDLAVDPRYRRRGIGSLLIQAGVDYMKRQGMKLAKIETLTTNEAGMVAYPKMGFVEVARQIHYMMPIED